MEISAKEEKQGSVEVVKLNDLELNPSSAALSDSISGRLLPPAGQRLSDTCHASELG